jgi:hypothetical protein
MEWKGNLPHLSIPVDQWNRRLEWVGTPDSAKPVNFSVMKIPAAILAAVLLASPSVPGQTIPNPSFETDTFTVFPRLRFREFSHHRLDRIP